MPRLSLVVAMSDNRVIGRDGALPWHLPGDLRRFRELTTGHTVIMGRRTFESIGRPLPKRRSIVLTRQRDYDAPGAIVAHTLDEALEHCADEDEVFIIGGGEIYRLALPRADRLHLTTVHETFPGDATFPELNGAGWRVVHRQEHPADDRHAHAWTYDVLERA